MCLLGIHTPLLSLHTTPQPGRVALEDKRHLRQFSSKCCEDNWHSDPFLYNTATPWESALRTTGIVSFTMQQLPEKARRGQLVELVQRLGRGLTLNPPAILYCNTCHTILVMAISCRGRASTAAWDRAGNCVCALRETSLGVTLELRRVGRRAAIQGGGCVSSLERSLSLSIYIYLAI